MKKPSLLMKFILGLVLINGLAFSVAPKYVSDVLGSKYQAEEAYFIMYYQGVTIPTGNTNYTEVIIERILDYDGVLLRVVSTDGDSIITADLTFQDPDGYTVSSNTITGGTAYTSVMDTPRARVRVFNPSSNVETVATLNISIWND